MANISVGLVRQKVLPGTHARRRIQGERKGEITTDAGPRAAIEGDEFLIRAPFCLAAFLKVIRCVKDAERKGLG